MIKKFNKKKISFTAINILFLILVSGGGAFYYYFLIPKHELEEKFLTDEKAIRNNQSPFGNFLPKDKQAVDEAPTKDVTPNQLKLNLPQAYKIPQKKHLYQTFNNCGPATLTMLLSYYGVSADQNTLGKQMRPYQNPQGDNDDKAVFADEFVYWAENYGQKVNLKSLTRANGSLELLKLFISHDIPVVTTNLLNQNEDIGHFLLIRGYDNNKQQLTADDSYYGPNRKYGYYDFMSLWQPFNYVYVIAYTDSQSDVVKQILGEEIDEKTAWKNTITRAQKESNLTPESIYPVFNMSTAYFHVGDYQNSIKYFEQVENKLPRRMLWYQIEPLQAYQALGKHDKLLPLIQNILDNGNRAFSELYYMRGEIYLEQEKPDQARKEFEQALFYHQGYKKAEDALSNL